MGLFENLGRKVEEFKQQAEQASAEEAPYRCAECGELLYTEHDECPECGSDRIRSRETDGDRESEGSREPDGDRETGEDRTTERDRAPENGSDDAGE